MNVSRIFFALENLIEIAEQTFCVHCTKEFQKESRQAINEAKKVLNVYFRRYKKHSEVDFDNFCNNYLEKTESR